MTTCCAVNLQRCVLARSSPTGFGMSRRTLCGALHLDLLATVVGI